MYPTRPLNEEIVTGIAIPQRNEIVTGVAIPADNDVFDLTVTAQQNFGGKPKIQNINSKSLLQFFSARLRFIGCSKKNKHISLKRKGTPF